MQMTHIRSDNNTVQCINNKLLNSGSQILNCFVYVVLDFAAVR